MRPGPIFISACSSYIHVHTIYICISIYICLQTYTYIYNLHIHMYIHEHTFTYLWESNSNSSGSGFYFHFYIPASSLAPSVPPIIFLTVTITPAAWFEFYRSVFTFIAKIESTNLSINIAHIYNFIQLSFILWKISFSYFVFY